MTVDYTRPQQPPTAPPPPSQPSRGWWSRNWKWFVPVGCLSFLLLGALLIAGLVGLVFGAMKTSDVYKEALQRAQNNPQVQAALGTPIESGWWLAGNINVQNDTGDANIQIPISGPKGKGRIHAVATKAGGKWNYSTLAVEVDGGGTIDLLGGS